jgi:hypothetical protein
MLMAFRRRRAAAVDTVDAGTLRASALRARLLRVLTAAAAIVLLAAAAASARGLDVRPRGLLPSGSTGVIVLDLSLSIADEDYLTVRGALRNLIDANAPVGLVVFSDAPYELFPPGTPARELRPLLRLLVPSGSGAPINPWTQSFRAGTRISTALELARDMLRRDGVQDGSILLVSDLETAPDDVPALGLTLEAFRRESVPLRVVPLSPSSDALTIFGGFLGDDDLEPSAPGPRRLSGAARGEFPVALLVLGGLFFAALAAHERFGGRLTLPRRAHA